MISMIRCWYWFAWLTMSGEHGRLFILVGWGAEGIGRFELGSGWRLYVVRYCFVQSLFILHYMRRTVLILCDKTTHVPLQEQNNDNTNLWNLWTFHVELSRFPIIFSHIQHIQRAVFPHSSIKTYITKSLSQIKMEKSCFYRK